MSEYVCRGIIKWAPFDGLAGFNDLYQQLKYKLNQIEKPQLSEEQLYYFDLTLKEAIYNNLSVSISYYQKGYINTIYGRITKIDAQQMKIYLENLPLFIKYITNIELC